MTGVAVARRPDVAAAVSLVRDWIAPNAAEWDREERLPEDIACRLGAAAVLAPLIPQAYGGAGLDSAAFGRICEEIGTACVSTRSLVTVQSMVAGAILRWGTSAQREHWLSPLCDGRVVAAFALTEPGAGSDAADVRTRASVSSSDYVLDGAKRWISFGEVADVFLVVARTDAGPSAFLVEGDSAGLERTPRRGLLGARASMLADLTFDGVCVPARNILGPLGMALPATAGTALDLGRFSIAWGCVGIGRAVLEASLAYAAERRQFGVPIGDHQLVRRLLAHMATGVAAARLLCLEAARRRDDADPDLVTMTLQAKLFASRTATAAAADAVQIHGAIGCTDDALVARHFRDSRVMEIIEGSTQVIESLVGERLIAGRPR